MLLRIPRPSRLSSVFSSHPYSLPFASPSREVFSEPASAKSDGEEWSGPSTSETVADRFRLDSVTAANKFVQSLGHSQKRHLLAALHECGSLSKSPATEAAFAEQLFQGADMRYPHGLLDRDEFIKALRRYKKLEEIDKYRRSQLPVPPKRLMTLAVANGVPFIGFGFLDNFIMIAAGESIEHAFGLKFGLSMMAAAAIGNLISDVAGIGLAEKIETTARKLFGLHAPRLSKFQQNTRAVRMSRMLGAAIGVSIGCILGMVPLLLFDLEKKTESMDE